MNILSKMLLITAILILVIATYLHPISAITQDLGRHIKTGQIIWTTQTIPKTNLFSYTYPNFPFINHHWGSEVLFYLTYTVSGFTGTLFLTFCISLIAFLSLYLYAYKKSHIVALSLVSFLSLGILFERTDVRPEAFSFLFLAIFITILFKNREKSTTWLYTLIPLQLLWTNIHVYFIIGIVGIGLFLLDTIITFFTCHPEFIRLGSARQVSGSSLKTFEMLKRVQHDRHKLFPLLIIFFLCVLMNLLNPNTLSGALYPFHVFDNYGYSIEENQNLFFLWGYAQKRTIVFFWIYVLLLFSTLFVRGKKTRPIDWLLAVTFTYLGISAIRNMPLLIYTTFIPFSYHLSNVIARSAKQNVAISKQSNNRAMKQWILVPCLLLLFLWQLFYILKTKPVGVTTPTGASKAVNFLQKYHLKGPIFNNFDIGSYIIFRLYPKEKIFVDGRPEAYPVSFFQQTYIPMQEDPKLFAKIDKKYHFNTIFFSHTDQTPWAKQFFQDIVKNPTWKIVYLDDTIIILSKKNAMLPPVSFTTFTPSSTSIQGLYQLLLFFQTIQDPQNMLKTAQKILQKDPNDCVALSLLSQTPTGIAYQARYQTQCQ